MSGCFELKTQYDGFNIPLLSPKSLKEASKVKMMRRTINFDSPQFEFRNVMSPTSNFHYSQFSAMTPRAPFDTTKSSNRNVKDNMTIGYPFDRKTAVFSDMGSKRTYKTSRKKPKLILKDLCEDQTTQTLSTR